jgi:hypothetical protein
MSEDSDDELNSHTSNKQRNLRTSQKKTQKKDFSGSLNNLAAVSTKGHDGKAHQEK